MKTLDMKEYLINRDNMVNLEFHFKYLLCYIIKQSLRWSIFSSNKLEYLHKLNITIILALLFVNIFTLLQKIKNYNNCWKLAPSCSMHKFTRLIMVLKAFCSICGVILAHSSILLRCSSSKLSTEVLKILFFN